MTYSMFFKTTLLTVFVCLVLLFTKVEAQNSEKLFVNVGTSLPLSGDFADNYELGFLVGGGALIQLNNFLTLQPIAEYQHFFDKSTSANYAHQITGGVNFLMTPVSFGMIEPFISAGYHVNYLRTDGVYILENGVYEDSSFSEVDQAIRAGIGAKADLNQRWGLLFSANWQMNLNTIQKFQTVPLSVGVTYSL